MPRPELDEALLLLRKAREDADAVRKLAPDAEIADSIVGFHAQQAAEKALKAVLAGTGDEFPWTHDLRHLIDMLDEAGMPLPERLRETRTLAPWAVEFRYGGTIDDQLDRAQALMLADGALVWAQNQIDGPVTSQPVSPGDRDAGIVRVPASGKHLLPSQPARIVVVLGGRRLEDARWNPRHGPDRERSGVIGIGRAAAGRLAEGQKLLITAIDGGVRLD